MKTLDILLLVVFVLLLAGVVGYFMCKPGLELESQEEKTDFSTVDTTVLDTPKATTPVNTDETFTDLGSESGNPTGMAVKLIGVDGHVNRHEDPIIKKYAEYAVMFAEDYDKRSLRKAKKGRAKVLQYWLDTSHYFEVKDVEIPYTFKRGYDAMPKGKHIVKIRVLDSNNVLYEAKR
ncbi:hypothetical protein ACFL54_08790, partial [Planctomycetota bacterium]